MHNHVGHRWIKAFLRKIISVLLVYSLFFTNTANASSLAGGSGWRVTSTVSNGIGVTVNGAKDIIVNGAKKTVTGVANVTPTAGQVGKFMGKNLGAAAVIGAMDLLLDGVDYVLDPANNTVVYNSKKDSDKTADPNFQYRCSTGVIVNTKFECGQIFLQNHLELPPDSQYLDAVGSCFGTDSISCSFKRKGETSYTSFTVGTTVARVDPYEEEEDKKTVSLVNLGSQVLDQAQEEVLTGNPAVPIATPVTQAAATAVIGEAATDEAQARPITAELDKSAAIPTDETAVGEIAPPTTNPETGQPNPTPLSLEFPVFCSWAPSLCVMADKVQQAITDATVWAKNDENQDTDNEPPEIEEIDIEALDTSTFTGVAGCPAPIVVPISFGDGGETEISYEPICQLAEKWSFVAPLIGFLSGAMIIVGVGRKGEDGEI